MVPLRRPYYRTSHCYSELSSRLLRQVVSPTITYIFAGDHAQARATGKGIELKGCFAYLDVYIAKNV